jgi:hypothetical protein
MISVLLIRTFRQKTVTVFSLILAQVLIMDKFTVKIIGYACKMAEITDAGISCKLPKTWICERLEVSIW